MIEETKYICDLPDWFDPKTCKIGIIYKKGIVEVDTAVTDENGATHIYNRKSERWEKE